MTNLLKNIFTIQGEECERLDKMLSKKFPAHSRSYFQHLIENEAVLLNGKIAKKRISPKPHDTIEVTFQKPEELDLTPESIPLDILYEDDDLICVNKPAGMVVHPAPGHPTGTFVHALLYHCQNLELPGEDFRPGIVHRLDKDTSGVLIAAKSLKAHQKLIEQFKGREIEKEYLAITIGHPTEQTINAPIGRSPIRRQEMAISEKGKEAITCITPLQKGEHFSLVLAKLITGRTHQIRVHLKHNQTPILGDRVYGSTKLNEKFEVPRQLLHAYRMKLFHPLTNEILILSAPLPDDMKNLSEKIFIQPIQY